MKTILIVDDEPRTREGVRKVLEAKSTGRYRIETAASGLQAIEWLEQHTADLLITDIRMPQLGGLDLIEQISEMPNPPVVIIISGHAEFDYAQKALKFGVVDYLLKPLDKHKLVQSVELAFKKQEEQERIEQMGKLVDSKLMKTMQEADSFNPSVQQAIQFVEEHMHEPLTMRAIAEHLHMNASYFSVLFKDQIGITFSEYLTRRRIQKAKELLLGTQLTIAEIAEASGYQSDKYFVKVFRSLEGVSPGQYRKSRSYDADKID